MSSTTDTMWKQRFVRRLNSITIICIIIGCIIHIGGFITGGILSSLFSFRSGTTTVGRGEQAATGSFSKLDCSLAIGDLIIQPGDEYSYEYKNYPSGKEPEIKLKNGTLEIRQKGNLDLWTNNKSYKDSQVIITVPAESGITADLKISMGQVEMNDLKLGDVKINANMGEVILKKCTTADIDIDANMGGINLTECDFLMGDLDANMGSINILNSSFLQADCDSDMGSITVSGYYNDLTADCDMGSIDVESENSDTKFDLDTDMGSVRVNGRDQGNKYKN